ncbi:hypothetical protein AC1031_019383 [Aphanomyces cochlioides]|nr:hypothetical protein AC1031_019383 [Aphanomyces cochlioides]
MAEKWTADCAAQRVLQELFDQKKIQGDSTPSYVSSLAPVVFNQYSDPVFALHLRRTKMANKLKNTAKRGRPAPSQVTFYDSSFDIPELAGKRRQIDDISADNGNEHPQNALENACALVCDYYDYVTKEKFVGLAVCLMWGCECAKSKSPQTTPKQRF